MQFPGIFLVPYILKGITCIGIDTILIKQPTSDLSFQNVLFKELDELV